MPEQSRRSSAWLGETTLDEKLRCAWRDQKIAAWRAQPPLYFDPRQWTELKEPDPDALVLRQVVTIAAEPRRCGIGRQVAGIAADAMPGE